MAMLSPFNLSASEFSWSRRATNTLVTVRANKPLSHSRAGCCGPQARLRYLCRGTQADASRGGAGRSDLPASLPTWLAGPAQRPNFLHHSGVDSGGSSSLNNGTSEIFTRTSSAPFLSLTPSFPASS